MGNIHLLNLTAHSKDVRRSSSGWSRNERLHRLTELQQADEWVQLEVPSAQRLKMCSFAAKIQQIIKEYYERIKKLEWVKYDLEYEVNKKDFEVSSLQNEFENKNLEQNISRQKIRGKNLKIQKLRVNPRKKIPKINLRTKIWNKNFDTKISSKKI